MLTDDPSNTLEPIFKFLQEVCAHNDPTADFVKSTISANNGALITCLVRLTKEKSISQDAIKVLDEVRKPNKNQKPISNFFSLF